MFSIMYEKSMRLWVENYNPWKESNKNREFIAWLWRISHMGKLVYDGKSVYEIDEDCLRKKEERERQKEMEWQRKESEKNKNRRRWRLRFLRFRSSHSRFHCCFHRIRHSSTEAGWSRLLHCSHFHPGKSRCHFHIRRRSSTKVR